MYGMRLRVVTAVLRGRGEADNCNQQSENRYFREKLARESAGDRPGLRWRREFHLSVSHKLPTILGSVQQQGNRRDISWFVVTEFIVMATT